MLSIDEDGFHLSATININGTKANVIIDTGASRTVFDKTRIKTYVKTRSKKIKDKLSSGLGTNTMQSSEITIAALYIGKLKIKNYHSVLLDLSHVNNSYKTIGLKPIDGVLGSDILNKHRAIIDYSKKTLILQS